ncbi:MAG TPA: helix-turn-helix domain-containing protein [Candidatus Dormibacteraeota bacterium]
MASGTKDEEKPGFRGQRLEDALAHPVRAQMFSELSKRPLGLPALADLFDKPVGWVRYHYRVLEAVDGIPAPDVRDS